ncbi:MAG: His/Gly/Thr/Pro-type tRNA ligase C-terminal domain-containing protein, partial [Gemmatimonadales bacterium]
MPAPSASSMGDVVLGELLKDRGLHPAAPSPIDVFAASITADDVPAVLAMAHDLRDAGVRVEYALNASAVGKQLTLAASRGARFAVVIGPDDRARGEVQLKDLGTKTQSSVTREELIPRLVSLLASHFSPASHG